ncbi:ABC transporter ATP-binding protein [Chloroflexota bacterium]
MTENLAIDAQELTKNYDSTTVVDHLNLQVREGEVFGLLGPNGAGKTTTILMLLGLTEPASGIAHVCGFNPTREPLKVKRIVGYLPEEVGFYETLTAKENLKFIAELNNINPSHASARIDEVLKMVGLTNEKNMAVGKFSRGMRQRLGIADVLIKEPKLAILDEPTSGLDPKGINQLLDVIAHLPEMGTTVLLSSHQLYQVQRVCHNVGVLSKGKLVIEGAIDKLGREALAAGRFIIEVETADLSTGLVDILKKIKGVIGVETTENMLRITTDTDLRGQISKAVVESGALLVQMKVQEFSLDDIYMKYFKESQ